MIEQLALFPQEIDEQKEVAMKTTGLETNWDDYILNKDMDK